MISVGFQDIQINDQMATMGREAAVPVGNSNGRE